MRIVIIAASVFALTLVSQCSLLFQQDQPGTFSYYSMVDFIGQKTLCPDRTTACAYGVQNDLAAGLTNDGWTQNNGITVTNVSGSWSADPQAFEIAQENANLLYISSHGSANPPMVCLRQCDGVQSGADYSITPSTLGNAWHGPTWLVIDACDTVQASNGWQNVFGGSLHGILGWSADTTGLGGAAQAEFARLIGGFATAKNAWEQATGVSQDPAAAAMLIPSANTSDVIEAAGGPHFGYNGDISPQYFSVQSLGWGSLSRPSTLATAPQAVYELVPEQMNENYWYNYYGGSSVPSKISHPSANEDLYENPYVLVDHYLASGGLVVSTASTGTAKGFSGNAAYEYALSWLQSNGGLPNDANLTYAGAETAEPGSGIAPTSDMPYPNTTRYMFIWRHAYSGVLGNDKILITVDDAGSLTETTRYMTYIDPHCGCRITKPVIEYAPPWVPAFHINSYVRLWRSVGSVVAAHPQAVTGSSYAYCTSDMADIQSTATPCVVTSGPTGTEYRDTESGVTLGSTESL